MKALRKRPPGNRAKSLCSIASSAVDGDFGVIGDVAEAEVEPLAGLPQTRADVRDGAM